MEYTVNEKYAEIGERLINTEPAYRELKDFGVRVAYLSCDKEKKANRKIIYADCTKVADKYKWTCDYDFFITVYEPNVILFTEEQMEILLRHELLHCGIDHDKDEPSFYVVPHDIEDFYTIIDKYGMDWNWTEEQKKCLEAITQGAEQT